MDRPTPADEFRRAVAVAIADAPSRFAQYEAECNTRARRGEIDLAAEKAQRWRRRPRPATVDRTAEAEASVVLGSEPAGPAPRLARIAGGMQRATAKPASPGACHVGEIAIAGEQQLMECGVGQKVSIQRMRPPHLDGADQHGQARTQ